MKTIFSQGISKALKLILISALSLGAQAFAQSSSQVVTGIRAVPTGRNKITVTWNLPKAAAGSRVSSLLVYRSLRAISSYSQIQSEPPRAALPQGTLSYTDTSDGSEEFFYAVVSCVSKSDSPPSDEPLYFDEELDKKPADSESSILKLILPGVNSTTEGARADGKRSAPKPTIQKKSEQKKDYSDKMREQPLPYIDILGSPGKERPSRGAISGESETRAKALAGRRRKIDREPLDIHVFEEDMASPAGGDDYLLFEILRTTFIKKKYSEAIPALRRFLAQNRTKSVSNRANFYLGECYYYTAQFPEALTQFLTLEDAYPALSRKWSESTLDMFEY